MVKSGEKKFGFHIEIGEWSISQTDPMNIVVSHKTSNSYFGKMEQAIDYLCKDKTLKENYITTLDELRDIYKKNRVEVLNAVDGLPF